MDGRRQKLGDWICIKRLGRGTYGEVTLWRNEKTMQQVAVKKCPVRDSDPDFKKNKMKERWKQELSIMHKEKNDYIVSGVDVDKIFLDELNKSSVLPALVMEYCDRGDLRRLLSNEVKNSSGLRQTEVNSVLRTLCSAIEYLHARDITHRDLKPENIVIKEGVDGLIFKVTDFGYAKNIEETIINSQVGTVGYFAPEVLTRGEYSPTVDFWSMGVVAFEVICGVRPFIPHQTVHKFIEQIKGKSANVIAITETKDNCFLEHERIFDENQVSGVFRSYIEKWLKIALDVSSKRGCMPETSGAPNEVRRGFFRHLANILNKRILTIFCLTSYKFLSYEITEQTEFVDLFREMERDTKIPMNKIFIILTPEHDFLNIQGSKPINLVLDNTDGPMIYICGLPMNSFNIKSSANPPQDINEILSLTNASFQRFYILELARKLVFFTRNEDRHYREFLKGLKTYGMILNHEICGFKNTMRKINNQKINGELNTYIFMLNYSKKRMAEKGIPQAYADLLSRASKIEQDIQQLLNCCASLHRRYKSVLKRSYEILKIPLLQDIERDFFDVGKIQKIYLTLQNHFADRVPNEECSPEETKILVNITWDVICMHEKLIHDPSIKDLETKLSHIHTEFDMIRNTVTDAKSQIDKYSQNVQQLIGEHLDEVWRIGEGKTMQQNIEDMDVMMSSIKLDAVHNGEPTLHFELGALQSSTLTDMDVSSLVDEDTTSIMDNNQNLMQSLQQIRSSFLSLLPEN